MCSRSIVASLQQPSFYFYYSFTSMSMNSFVNLSPEEMKLTMAHLQFRFRD
jgi:hypothetical protein